MQHYLTYQHNVQRLFREHRDKYDGVIVPLSIATSFPTGTYGFIRALCASDDSKQYAIDPRNALFQHAWNRESARDPHRKMASALGEPYPTIGLSAALTAEDFKSDDILRSHVERTLKFQRDFCQREEDARKLAKYKKMLGLDSLGKLSCPQHLIPPYYQISGMRDPWLEVNLRCISAAHDYSDGLAIRPTIHFKSWSDLDWSNLLDQLRVRNVDSIWMYANNFREHDSSNVELNAYVGAVKACAEKGIKCYSLFGGYFAILLSHVGLSGFANGIGYGEWRDSGYHRGGTADTRIYLLKLHRYVDTSIAQSIVERDPDYFGADTEVISGYVESGVSLVNIDRGDALDHFMECRQRELTFVQEKSKEEAAAELKDTALHLKEIGLLEYEKFGHSLSAWASILDLLGTAS